MPRPNASPCPEITLTIDSLGGLGDGVGHAGNKPVYIPKTCAGDELKVRITSQTKAFDRGEIITIIKAGTTRIDPPCPHYAACGGCSLQHLTPTAYQEFKRRIAQQALGYSGFSDSDMKMIFLPADTRRRSAFKVKDGTLAYHGLRSHQLTTIEHCCILTPALQALLAPLNQMLRSLPDVTDVALTQADSGIDIQLQSRRPLPEHALHDFANTHDVARINHIERRPVTMRLGTYDVPLPATAFLQASAEAQQWMTNKVLTTCSQAKRVVDLFCGIGTYSLPLSAYATAHAVELDANMVTALKTIAPHVTTERRDLFKDPLSVKELSRFDAAVINPPRAGAHTQIEQLAKSNIARIIMISCNPATWSRDARILKDSGFSLISLDVVDQFVYSSHIELVSVFDR